MKNKCNLEEITNPSEELLNTCVFNLCGFAKLPKQNELDGDGIKIFADLSKNILSIILYKNHLEIGTRYFLIKEDNLTRDKFYDLMLSFDAMNFLKEFYPYNTMYLHH